MSSTPSARNGAFPNAEKGKKERKDRIKITKEVPENVLLTFFISSKPFFFLLYSCAFFSRFFFFRNLTFRSGSFDFYFNTDSRLTHFNFNFQLFWFVSMTALFKAYHSNGSLVRDTSKSEFIYLISRVQRCNRSHLKNYISEYVYSCMLVSVILLCLCVSVSVCACVCGCLCFCVKCFGN